MDHAWREARSMSRRARPALIRRLALALPLIALLAFNLVGSSSNLANLRDFGSFVASGRAANAGLNPYGIYNADPNLNPPVLLLAFGPLARLDPLSLSLAFAVLAVAALARAYPSTASPPRVLWVLSLAGVWFTLQMGQLYTLMLLLVAAAWLLLRRGRQVPAGILLGLLVAAKPQFGLWPLLLLIGGLWPAALAAASVAGALTALPILRFGPGIYRSWLSATSLVSTAFSVNASIPGLFARLSSFWPGTFSLAARSLTAVGFLLAGALVVGVCALVWRRRPAIDEIGALGLVAALLASPISWVGYTCLLAPIFLSRRWNPALYVAGLLLLVPAPIIWAAGDASRVFRLASGMVYLAALLLILWTLAAPYLEGASDAAAAPNRAHVVRGLSRPELRSAALRLPIAGLEAAWLLMPAVVVFAIVGLSQVMPHDFWWHVRTGQIILAGHAIPVVDSFTFTRTGFPWTNQAWLMQVILYLLYSAGGLPLVIFAVALLTAGGYALVQAAAYGGSGGHARAAALATMLAAAVGILDWGFRPQAASFLCFGALVWVIERHDRSGGRCLWAAPILFAAWVNLHAGFAYGILLLGVYTICTVANDLVEHGQRSAPVDAACPSTGTLRSAAAPEEQATQNGHRARRPMAIPDFVLAAARRLGARSWTAIGAGLASLAALCINPAGPRGIVSYLLGFLPGTASAFYSLEFAPLTVREEDGKAFFAAVLLLAGLVYIRRLRLRPYLLVAMILLGLFTLYARRGAPWFGMAAVPALAAAFAPGVSARVRRAPARPALNIAVLGLLVACAVIGLPWVRPALPLPPGRQALVDASQTPLRAASVLCGAPQGVRLFNSQGYGSYLEWACPGLKVFVDTRIELYTQSIWQDYLSASSGEFDWEKVLKRYGINTVLLNKQEQGPLVAALQATGDWRTLYEDRYTLLARLQQK